MRIVFLALAWATANVAIGQELKDVKFEQFAKAPGYSEGPSWRAGEVYFCSGALLRVNKEGKVAKQDTKLQELAAELAPVKGKRRSSTQTKRMKQVVVRELKNGTPAEQLAGLFNTTVGNINQMRYR